MTGLSQLIEKYEKFTDPTFHVQFVLQSTIECLNFTTHIQVLFFLLCYYDERARIARSVLRLATGWTVRVSHPGVARFSASVQSGPGAHPSSHTMGTGSPSRGLQQQVRGFDQPHHLAAMLKKE